MAGIGTKNSSYQGVSLQQLLATAYPEYEWLPWKFSEKPKHLWQDEGNKRKFIEWIATQLNIKDESDWYKVSTKVYSIFIIIHIL